MQKVFLMTVKPHQTSKDKFDENFVILWQTSKSSKSIYVNEPTTTCD